MAVGPQTLSKTGYLHGSPASRGAEFASLYREYFPRLVRLLTRRTGDSAVAEDLAQEVLLRALQAPSSFDRSAPMWPWLKTVALRLAIDHYRRNSREIPSEQTCCPLLDETRSGADSLLPEVVASLPPRERAAVSLHYLDGWKTSETASFLGMSRPALDQLLFRARRRLRTNYRQMARDLTDAALIPVGWVAQVTHRLISGSRLGEAASVLLRPAGDAASLSALAGALAVLLMAPPDPGTTRSGRVTDGRPTLAAPGAQRADDRRSGRYHVSRQADGGRERGESSGLVPGGGGAQKREPAGRVTGPEDTRVTSVAAAEKGRGEQSSGRNSRGGLIFAAGNRGCGPLSCEAFLFRSSDDGATWERLPARGFQGTQLLLPPSFPGGVDRLFAMGPSGLQLSEDGGLSFSPAGLSGSVTVTGPAAISPDFHSTDPSILIGAQVLMRYDDTTKAIMPVLLDGTNLAGPFDPVFLPPNLIADFVLGATRPRHIGSIGDQPGFAPSIYVCGVNHCTWRSLRDGSGIARVRLNTSDPSGRNFVFTEQSLAYSEDGLTSLLDLSPPWWAGSAMKDTHQLSDLAVVQDSVIAAVNGTGPQRGVWVSGDRGTSWERVESPLFPENVGSIFLTKERVFLTVADQGLVCSTDLGRTWGKACGE